jgi:hypothetical protein
MQAWISDLGKAGYTFPALRRNTSTATAAAAAPRGGLTPDVITKAPLERTFAFPKRWCLHQDKAMVVNFHRLGQYNSVQQIKLLHAAYRPLFSKVLFYRQHGQQPRSRTAGAHQSKALVQLRFL